MKNNKEQLIDAVNKALGTTLSSDILADPPDISMGDVALPCFLLAKERKESPVQVAHNLVTELGTMSSVPWERVMANGPYVNFFMKPDFWHEPIIITAVSGAKRPKIKEKVMVEFSQPNTHKEFHVGHLRTAFLGMSLVRLSRYAGYDVVAANYIGDVGTHVAKCLWNYMKRHAGDPLPVNKGKYLGEVYAEATQLIGDNEELKAEVSDVLQRLEAGDEEMMKIWQQTRDWSMEQFRAIYDEWGVVFDVWFYESEEEKAADRIIRDIVASGKVPQIKVSEGAIVADLQEFDLGVLVLIKSDGTKAYGAKDIPLTMKKFDDFKIDQSVWVVDKRQSLYFKQIFKIMDLLGYRKKMAHVDYDFVTLPDGAMSSRKGNVISYEDFRDVMLDRMVHETRERHPEWAEDRIHGTAAKVTMAAIKFGILKYENKSTIVFDMDAALLTEGATGPYILYSMARIHSIFRKLAVTPIAKNIDYGLLREAEERQLIKQLSQFDDVVEKCVIARQPSYLCTYLLEMAQSFNSFYHHHSISKAEPALQEARLALARAVLATLQRGLTLLNIESVEEM